MEAQSLKNAGVRASHVRCTLAHTRKVNLGRQRGLLRPAGALSWVGRSFITEHGVLLVIYLGLYRVSQK